MKKTDLSSLSREELERRYIDLQEAVSALNIRISWYEEQYRKSKEKMYGKSTEKDLRDNQVEGQLVLPIFNEAEALLDPIHVEEDLSDYIEDKNVPKKKKSRKKDTIKLPVQEEVFTLSEEERVCPKCGGTLHEMKQEVHLSLEVIPAKVYVKKTVVEVYACRECEKNGSSSIVKAKEHLSLIDKSMASPSLVSDFIVKKYQDAMPFYRQEQNYKRQGIPVTRNNMCNWSIKVARNYLKGLKDLMREELFQEHVIHCDETYTEVLQEENRPASRKSYIWVLSSSEYLKEKKIALYEYKEGRAAVDAREVLKGYSGYLMCDGYKVYDTITKVGKHGEAPMDIQTVACLVHVRRKFADALKLISPKSRPDTSAQLAINKIAKIFDVDKMFRNLSPEERKFKRKEHLKPLLDDFFAWIKKESELALPESHYGKAVEYALNQKEKVERVLLDGRLELHNNMAERCVKPFVIGRKNWLFSNTPMGAEASCILYSIIETAKLNDCNPYEYLKYVLETLSQKYQITRDDLRELLPWSSNLPDHVKNPKTESME